MLLLFYISTWDGSGKMALNWQQRKIPPIVAQETTTEISTISVEVNIYPIRLLGGTTDDVINGNTNAPISGGVKTYGTETNTEEGDAKLQVELSTNVTIETQGSRSIGPFNCTGLTGHSCCLMIKHKVRDSDLSGRAIQCYLDYQPDTIKHKALLNSRGKKVFIFQNHNGKVSKDPKVVGGWPQGKVDSDPDFHDWIQDGGGLSDAQMKLIHGEDWVSPNPSTVQILRD